MKLHSASSTQGQVVSKLGHQNAEGMQESANGFPVGKSAVSLKRQDFCPCAEDRFALHTPKCPLVFQKIIIHKGPRLARTPGLLSLALGAMFPS